MSVVFLYLLKLHIKGQKALQKLISLSPLTLQVLSEANLVCSEVRLPRHPGAVLILLTTTLTELCHWHRRVSGFPLQMWLFTPEPWPGYFETQSSVFVTIEYPFHLDLMILTLFVRRPTSDVDIFVFPVDPRHLPAKVEGAVAKNKAWNVKKIIQISTV